MTELTFKVAYRLALRQLANQLVPLGRIDPTVQLHWTVTDRRLAGQARQIEPRFVHIDNTAFGKARDRDADRTGVKDGRQEGFTLAQVLLRPLSGQGLEDRRSHGLQRFQLLLFIAALPLSQGDQPHRPTLPHQRCPKKSREPRMPGGEPNTVRVGRRIIGEEALAIQDHSPVKPMDRESREGLVAGRRVGHTTCGPTGIAQGDVDEAPVRGDLAQKAEFAAGDLFDHGETNAAQLLLRAGGHRLAKDRADAGENGVLPECPGFSPLPSGITLDLVERERDIQGHLLQQRDFRLLKKTRFFHAEIQRAPDLSLEPDRERAAGVKAEPGWCLCGWKETAPGDASIADERLALPDGSARIALPLGSAVRVELRRIEDFCGAAEGSHRKDFRCQGIQHADPCQIDLSTFHHDTADGRKQLLPRTGPDHHLVHLAEHVVEPIGVADSQIGSVLVDRNLYGRLELPVVKGLQHETVGFRVLRPFHRGVLGIGREKDHRFVIADSNPFGGGDAVHLPLQTDIHEHQVRTPGLDQSQRLLARERPPDHLVAHPYESFLDVHRNESFVLNDQDAARIHGRLLRTARTKTGSSESEPPREEHKASAVVIVCRRRAPRSGYTGQPRRNFGLRSCITKPSGDLSPKKARRNGPGIPGKTGWTGD